MFDLPKYRIFELILDKVIDEVTLKQDKFVFNNLREAKGYQHRNYREILNLQKKVRNCIFPGCSSSCIPKSHTIQRASLQLISESQHLLTPGSKEGKTTITSVGINEASTFPGFCQVHEEVFKEFEKNISFDSDRSYQLQIFRTLCREIVVKESQIDGFQKAKDNYIQYRNLQFTNRFKELSGPIFTYELQRLNIDSENWRLSAIDRKINETSKQLRFLKKLYRKLYSDIKSNQFSKFCIAPIEFDWLMPVTLAGMAGFSIKKSKKYEDTFLFINVIPLENKTLVILGGEAKYKNFILKYHDSFCNPLEAINIIERWMVYGTDHWFIRPSVWKKIPKERQQKIIVAVSKADKCIFDNFSLSIFDDLRKQFISLTKSNKDFFRENQDFITNEEKKLS